MAVDDSGTSSQCSTTHSSDFWNSLLLKGPLWGTCGLDWVRDMGAGTGTVSTFLLKRELATLQARQTNTNHRRAEVRCLNPEPDSISHTTCERHIHSSHSDLVKKSPKIKKGQESSCFSRLVYEIDWSMRWIQGKPPWSPENTWGTWEYSSPLRHPSNFQERAGEA